MRPSRLRGPYSALQSASYVFTLTFAENATLSLCLKPVAARRIACMTLILYMHTYWIYHIFNLLIYILAYIRTLHYIILCYIIYTSIHYIINTHYVYTAHVILLRSACYVLGTHALLILVACKQGFNPTKISRTQLSADWKEPKLISTFSGARFSTVAVAGTGRLLQSAATLRRV